MIDGGTYILNSAKWPFRALRRRLWKIEPRAANPYATHVPVLVACALLFKPARILEIGSGRISTPLFLNRQIFPDVVQVQSLENDPRWFAELADLEDSRLERVFVNGAIRAAVENVDCSAFDLIFVDDSPSAQERKKTLDVLRRKILGSQIVVVHDFETWPIRLAMHWYPRHEALLALNPQTAIAWNKRSVRRSTLRRVDDVLRAFHGQIREEDGLAWRIRLMESIPDGG